MANPFWGYRQTVQIQFRFCRTLIRFYTVNWQECNKNENMHWKPLKLEWNSSKWYGWTSPLVKNRFCFHGTWVSFTMGSDFCEQILSFKRCPLWDERQLVQDWSDLPWSCIHGISSPVFCCAGIWKDNYIWFPLQQRTFLCQWEMDTIPIAVLQIRRDNRDNLGIIIPIYP